MQLDEIIKRYHYDSSSADMFAHRVAHPKDENQLIIDVHYLIKTLVDVRKEILNCLIGVIT